MRGNLVVRSRADDRQIDLADLFELFEKTAKKPLIEDPISSEARKWRANFAVNVEAILRVRDVPRVEAEKVAFANTVTAFLDAAHPDTPSDRCAHCARVETPDATLQPIGWGARHTWLHQDCWTPWRERRSAEAIAALAETSVP